MKSKFFNLLMLLLLPGLMFATALFTVPAHEATHRLVHEPSRTEIHAAIESWKMLSGKEKRHRMKAVRQELRAQSFSDGSERPAAMNKTLLFIIAILLPPLAIYLFEGEIRKCFWISILLTLLFWIPGVIYAIVIINKDWKKYHPK